jgi:1-aminocyclopropane-1-carboxylate deaminase/D-cysteine desulfhydrase-like pyridoxal-dependent ACC family enzyme
MEVPLGAISYVRAFSELASQAEASGLDFNFIVHSSGSGGTQAGLVVGSQALKRKCRVLGISVSEEKESFGRDVRTISAQAAEALGLKLAISDDDVIVFDEYIGEGYGLLTSGVAEALRLVFKTEGVVLDPVYTGKAMAGLIDLIRKGYFKPSDRVVFFHTGGTAALFPYRNKLAALLAPNAKTEFQISRA